MYIVMFEFTMLNHPIINDLPDFCFNVSSHLDILSKISKLYFEKVYSIVLFSNLFCLITIYICNSCVYD